MNSKKTKVLFVLCTGHSGSTLLDILLGQHHSVTGLGECERVASSYQQKLLCACGEPADTCLFWSGWFHRHISFYQKGFKRLYFKNLFSWQYKILDSKGKYTATTEDIDEYRAASISLYNYARATAGTQTVVDSSKNTQRFILLNKSTQIDSVVLHLVRDPRGVAFSYWKKYGQVIWPVVRWVKENVYIMYVAKKTGKKRIMIRYEKLASEPEKTLREICSKLHMEYDPDMLAFKNTNLHQPAGNRIRFNGVSEIKFDTEWRNKLPLLVKGIAVFLGGCLLLLFILEEYVVAKK
jgi:hypothetical protein